MGLTRHHGEGLYHIRSVSRKGIVVNDTLYNGALIIGADTLIDSWPVSSAEQFSKELFKPILEMKADLLLI